MKGKNEKRNTSQIDVFLLYNVIEENIDIFLSKDKVISF